MKKHTEAWWAPMVHALVHVVIGTVIFAIIALAALLLDLFVHWLGTLGVSGYVIDVLTHLGAQAPRFSHGVSAGAVE